MEPESDSLLTPIDSEMVSVNVLFNRKLKSRMSGLTATNVKYARDLQIGKKQIKQSTKNQLRFRAWKLNSLFEKKWWGFFIEKQWVCAKMYVRSGLCDDDGDILEDGTGIV